MSSKKEKEEVVNFLKENPGSNKKSITAATGSKGIQLVNILRQLEQEGLQIEGEGAEAVYTLSEKPAISVEAEEGGHQEEEELDLSPKSKVKKGRDNSKFKFNGNEYPKGHLVRAVVAAYVESNPKITTKQLKEVFPDTLLKRFGIFQQTDEARSISGTRDRYFFKEEHQIKLGDKKTIVVCNQFTLDNIQPFLTTAKTLGYKIKQS